MIPHSKPCLGVEEAEAVKRVISSGQLAQGPEVFALERELADFIGVKGAVAVSSGTAGLHLSLEALNIRQGCAVHIPSFVCTALLNAVNYTGAEAIICDVDPMTGNMSYEDLLRRLNDKPQAVILPHMFGIPVNPDKFISSGHPVIEDCAQSIGAETGGKKTGAFGILSVFSFYATKLICGGEGGAVVSNSLELLETIRNLRDYDEQPEYRVRYNYKMTDLQAAVVRIQLRKLPEFIRRRQTIAQIFDKAVDETSWNSIDRPKGAICFRYLIKCSNADKVIKLFREKGISCAGPVYKPLHRYFDFSGYPGTEQLYSTAVSIPCYPALRDEEIQYISKSIKELGKLYA
ncbi:DegT/DnrJ/EryC1/StrS family aminotransferase [bacterium]|nr:DegT/DnrJ/EryC1/StrS family aminotransferase [FCB group bacterium]MBL7190502.1 DegT/DnrJ/EryC1/StrS family aminotransferase [bacterium]